MSKNFQKKILRYLSILNFSISLTLFLVFLLLLLLLIKDAGNSFKRKHLKHIP